MIPISLELWNYQAHRHSILDFSKLDNITLIIGEYEDQKERSNGSGKSSLLEGLLWILFDDSRINTNKSLSNDELIRDDQDFVEGKYTFISHDKNTYLIGKKYVRAQKRTTYTIQIKDKDKWKNIDEDLKKDTKKLIIKLLGFDKDIFLNTSLCKQHEVYGIVNEGSTERLGLIKKILKLDIHNEYAQACKRKLEEIELQLSSHREMLLKGKDFQDNLLKQKELIRQGEIKVKAIETQIQLQQSEIEKLREQNTEYNKTIGAIEQLKKTSTNHDTRIQSLNKEKVRIASQRKDLEKRLVDLKQEQQVKTERIRQIDNNRPNKEKMINEYRVLTKQKADNQQTLGTKIGILQGISEQGKAKRKELDAFLLLGIGECDKCKNEISHEHKDLVSQRIESELQSLREKGSQIVDEKVSLESSIEDLEKQLKVITDQQDLYNSLTEEKNTLTERLKAVHDILTNSKASLDNSTVQLGIIDEELKTLIDEIKQINNRLGSLGGVQLLEKQKSVVGQLHQAVKNLEGIQKQQTECISNTNIAKAKATEIETVLEELKKAELTIQPLLRQKELHEILYKDFMKTIPTMILENYAALIEEEVNRCLLTLSDGFAIKIITQFKNKTNENTREVFDIQVTVNGKQRTFEQLSGGEKFRVAFAIRVALCLVVARETGIQIGIMFYDEPFNDLDEDGLDKLKEIFVMLMNSFRYQLAITHQSRLKESFNNVICVRKTKDGSTISIE